MKDYDLNIECLREDGCGVITEMFSKGHHKETEFKSMCKEVYAEEQGENKEDINTESYYSIDAAELVHCYGKKVGWFEDGKRRGYSLSESSCYKKGYFPMTKIEF